MAIRETVTRSRVSVTLWLRSVRRPVASRAINKRHAEAPQPYALSAGPASRCRSPRPLTVTVNDVLAPRRHETMKKRHGDRKNRHAQPQDSHNPGPEVSRCKQPATLAIGRRHAESTTNMAYPQRHAT